jgi:hypothetical protein
LEKDSHAKVQMRKKVRGLRGIEKQVLDDRRAAQAESIGEQASEPPGAESKNSSAVAAAESAANPAAGAMSTLEVVGESGRVEPLTGNDPVEPFDDEAGDVVLDYCGAVRGILNDDQGGPLHPPGLRMADALQEVRESLQRNLDAKKGGAARSSCAN